MMITGDTVVVSLWIEVSGVTGVIADIGSVGVFGIDVTGGGFEVWGTWLIIVKAESEISSLKKYPSVKIIFIK